MQWPRGARRRFAVALAALAAGAALWLLLGPAPALDPGGDARLATPVYSVPLEITPGDGVRALDLEGHLARTGYRRVSGRAPRPGEFFRGKDVVRIARRPFEAGDGLEAGGLLQILLAGDRVSGLRDADGRALERARLEPECVGVLDRDGARWQEHVRLDDVPQRVLDALIAVEDRRFYAHGGLDLHRIGGAALANLRARRVVQGGSTLTQQLSRSLYLDREKSWLRKLREAVLALRLERGHDKREILEAYVNEIYMGHRDGLPVHGFAAAAHHWFGRPLGELDLPEQALLIGMIQAPNRFASGHRPERGRARRAAVLAAMQERGLIDAAQAKAAGAAPLPPVTPPARLDARFYLDWLRAGLAEDGLADLLEPGGGRVYATLDARLQRAAEAAVSGGLVALEKSLPRLQKRGLRAEAALVALDPLTGDVRALVGGRDYAQSQFNRATQARRQPGSAFKPVVALAALGGDGSWPAFTLASLLDDLPVSVDTPAGPWKPQNYDGEFRGPVTLRTALEQSLNVPIARLGIAIGPQRVIATARALGIESPLPEVASLSLGVSELTPLELTRAYAVLAAEGQRAELRGIARVVGPDGLELARSRIKRAPAVDPAAAYLVTSALMGAVERGTARRLRALGVRAEVAAKTGTTNDFRDAWLVGYTPAIALGVWVGIDGGEALGVSGATAALPLFADFMRRAGLAAQGPDFQRPESIESVSVDARTGLRAGFGCPGETEVFLAGTSPERSCGWFARFTDPLPQASTRWWQRQLEGEAEVSAAPRAQAAPEHPDTCRVRFAKIKRIEAFNGGRTGYVYRVEGVAGQGGRLHLSSPFPRRIDGPALPVATGAFDEELEIELPARADALLVELELDGGKRCTDSARLP